MILCKKHSINNFNLGNKAYVKISQSMSLPIEVISWECKKPQQTTEPHGVVYFCSAEQPGFKNLCPFCVLEHEKLL